MQAEGFFPEKARFGVRPSADGLGREGECG
jgi:hypothetical protein